jgi:hypothetical protein
VAASLPALDALLLVDADGEPLRPVVA